MQRNVVLAIPGERIQKNLALPLAAVQHVRKQNAVVISVWLVAIHRDIETIRAPARQDLFDRACAGHSVSDDNKIFFFHNDTFEIRAAQTLNSGIRDVRSSAGLVSKFARPAAAK